MYNHTRKYTNKLLEMVEEGIIDPKEVMEAFLCYLSERQVEDMMHVNDFILDLLEDAEDEDDAALDDFNYVGSRHHY